MSSRTTTRPARHLLIDRDLERLRKQSSAFDTLLAKRPSASALADFDAGTERLIIAVFGETAEMVELYRYAQFGEAASMLNLQDDAQEAGALDLTAESLRQRRRAIESCIWELEARRAAAAKKERPVAIKSAYVADYMSRDVRSVHMNATLQDAGRLLQKHKIGLLFVDDDKRYVGVITDSALGRKAVGQGLDPTKTLVKSCMTKRIVSIENDQPLIEAVKTMKDHGVRHLAVTEDNTIVGVISISDVLRYYSGVE
jgi:CBS domain-containing protein